MDAMKIFIALLVSLSLTGGCDRRNDMSDNAEQWNMPPLSDQQRHVIENAATEAPFSGEYWDHFETGVYVCRRCGSQLYKSDSKFESHCGWPSFDDEIPGAVTRRSDPDGSRTEIVCSNCNGHLGHVFLGEGFTAKNTRHCVNSLSMQFIPAGGTPNASDSRTATTAYFAGGCFWGVEHHMGSLPGIISIRTGYMGGKTENPTYEQICRGNTGHAESIEVIFDPKKLDYESLARRFFEIHDPTEYMRQGNDIGSQYRSAIFFTTEQQKLTAEKLISLLKQRGYNVVTELEPAEKFWAAEEYHQDYLEKNPNGYCAHVVVKRFDQDLN